MECMCACCVLRFAFAHVRAYMFSFWSLFASRLHPQEARLHSSRSSLRSKSWLGGAFTTASASPTCLRSVTSRWSFRRLRRIRDGDRAPAAFNCYWRGSDEEDRRLRCKYTSVPYLRDVNKGFGLGG